MADELTPLNDALEPQIQMLPANSKHVEPWRDAALVSIAISLKRIADVFDLVTNGVDHPHGSAAVNTREWP